MWRFVFCRVTHGAGGLWGGRFGFGLGFGFGFGFGDWVRLGVVGLALGPWVGNYLWRLSDRAYFEYTPLALVLFGWLVVSRGVFGARGSCWADESFPLWRTVAWLMGVFAGAVAIAIDSGWLAYLALLGLLFLQLARVRETKNGHSLVSCLWPLLTLIRPPLNLDLSLANQLQLLSAVLTSRWLDLLGVLHLRSGQRIELVDRVLEIETGCSGIRSLFGIGFCAVAYAVLRRHSGYRLSLLVVAAVVVAVIANSLRILAIALAQVCFQIDLTSGAAHELVGSLALGLTLLLLLGFDLWCSSIVRRRSVDEKDASFVADWNRVAFLSCSGDQLKRSRGVGSRMVLSLASGLLLGYSVFTLIFLGREERLPFDLPFQSVPESLLAKDLDSWRFERSELVERSRTSDWGRYSTRWTFYDPDQNLHPVVSVDYPFEGWHELTQCYQNDGWKLLEREVRGDWVVALLEREDQGRALLVFGLWEGEMRAPPGGTWNGLIEDARERVFRPRRAGYQVQVFWVF